MCTVNQKVYRGFRTLRGATASIAPMGATGLGGWVTKTKLQGVSKFSLRESGVWAMSRIKSNLTREVFIN